MHQVPDHMSASSFICTLASSLERRSLSLFWLQEGAPSLTSFVRLFLTFQYLETLLSSVAVWVPDAASCILFQSADVPLLRSDMSIKLMTRYKEFNYEFLATGILNHPAMLDYHQGEERDR